MVWAEIGKALAALKDALHVEPKPQQEPKYQEIAALLKATDGTAPGVSPGTPLLGKAALDLFYQAAKWDAGKELLIALISNASKLLSLMLLLQALESWVKVPLG